jgi:hypothetical protein
MGWGMRALKVNDGGEHRQRISDELRQLKQLSKGLRSKALRDLLERHAVQRRGAKRTPRPKPVAA